MSRAPRAESVRSPRTQCMLDQTNESAEFCDLFSLEASGSQRIHLLGEGEKRRPQAPALGRQIDEPPPGVGRILGSVDRAELLERSHRAHRRVVPHSGTRAQLPLTEPVFLPQHTKEIPLTKPHAVRLDPCKEFSAESPIGVAKQVPEALSPSEIDGLDMNPGGRLRAFRHHPKH
jgi:hypothetical protein